MSSENVADRTEWYTDPAEIARLLRWRQERGELTLTEAIHIVEEPWSYSSDFRAMLLGDLLGEDVALEFGRRLDALTGARP